MNKGKHTPGPCRTMNLEQDVLKAVNKAIGECIEKTLTGYNSPLNKFVEEVIVRHRVHINEILESAVSEALQDSNMEQVREAIKLKLARSLVQSFGGEIQKRVNEMKADPTTRARITVALDNIVKDQLK